MYNRNNIRVYLVIHSNIQNVEETKMKDLKVIGWTDWFNNKYTGLDRMTVEDEDKVHEVIAKELRDKGYKFTGDYHQQGDYGAPVIKLENNEEYLFKATQREWGAIMAQVYTEHNKGDGYDYCVWAWLMPENIEIILPAENVRIETEW